MISATVIGELERHAAEQPGRLFVEVVAVGKRTRLTYGDLADATLRFAKGYVNLGVKPGDQVAILTPHRAEQYPAYLGVMRAGAVPSFLTPLNVKSDPEKYWPSQRILFDRVKPDLIVTDAAGVDLIRQNLPDLDVPLVAIDAIAPEAVDAEWTPPAVQEKALIQYSSGTTGPRKAVALNHQAVVQQSRSYAMAIGLEASDRIASWLPLYHDMGLISAFMTPLVMGTPVVSLDPFEWVARPGMLFDEVVNFKATLCWLPNFAYMHLVRVAPRTDWDLSGLRAVINCSEPCRGTTFDAFFERFSDCGLKREALQTCYAMAENVYAVTQTPTGKSVSVLGERGAAFGGADILSAGVPIEGVEVRLVNEENQPVEDGHLGQVAIRSELCIERYYGASASTLDQNGWYRTGDLGVSIEGELFVIGRLDDVIVTRGKNIFAHEVEAVLSMLDGVKPGRCAVLGVSNDAAGTSELVVVAETTGSRVSRELRADISRAVEYGFGIAPSGVYFVPEAWIMKSSSGKIARRDNVQKLARYLIEA